VSACNKDIDIRHEYHRENLITDSAPKMQNSKRRTKLTKTTQVPQSVGVWINIFNFLTATEHCAALRVCKLFLCAGTKTNSWCRHIELTVESGAEFKAHWESAKPKWLELVESSRCAVADFDRLLGFLKDKGFVERLTLHADTNMPEWYISPNRLADNLTQLCLEMTFTLPHLHARLPPNLTKFVFRTSLHVWPFFYCEPLKALKDVRVFLDDDAFFNLADMGDVLPELTRLQITSDKEEYSLTLCKRKGADWVVPPKLRTLCLRVRDMEVFPEVQQLLHQIENFEGTERQYRGKRAVCNFCFIFCVI
jgi:hypothetical protein